MKVSLPRIFISSSVSRLSVTKAGQTTSKFCIPSSASLTNSLSVKGCIQPGPILDWKDTPHSLSLSYNFFAQSLEVSRT